METKIMRLFDYQRFTGNARLNRMLRLAQKMDRHALTDEELTLVSAAGDLTENSRKALR